MYELLFAAAGVAMAGWIAMILLPGWRVTQWLAGWSVFPVYLSVVYLAGILPIVVAAGPGIMREFGSIEGVIRLLATSDVALIAWVHLLAFDHLVGVLIYRDNQRERVVPLPLQSAILFLTLMFGPVGFLSYIAIRMARRGSPALHLASASRGTPHRTSM